MNFFKILILFIAALYCDRGNAQTRADIFTSKNLPITWLGIDFSSVAYIGDPGTVDPEEMKVLFNKINFLIPSEPNKYDLKAAFKKDSLSYNISSTVESNQKINTSKLISFNSSDYKRLDESAIKKIVSGYNFENGEKGVGLMFVMDGLNKTEEEAAMWVTFINIDTKEVIFTEMLAGRTMGFGFRNHWAGTVCDVIAKVDVAKYWQWKKKYAPSK
jgi:hypothetical protein